MGINYIEMNLEFGIPLSHSGWKLYSKLNIDK